MSAHELARLALDQNNYLFLRALELPKSFEHSRCIGKDPKEDADHRYEGKEGQQQCNEAIASIAFIEVIEGKRPAKSQESELDECLLFKSLHGWKFCITT